jgi:hypothetical protein
MASEYKITQVIPDDGPWLAQVHGCSMITRATAGISPRPFQYQGAAPQPGDPMIQSMSNVASTIFIFQR